MSPVTFAFFAAMLGAPVLAQAAPITDHPNLLRNGGFEQGSFGSWALGGNTEYSQVFNQDYDGLSAHGGTYYALLGPQGEDGVLSQSFADVVGEKLTISFWLASDGGTQDDFTALFDGTAVMHRTDAGRFGWTHYRETVIGTGEDTLSFSFSDDQDYWALDQVHVGGEGLAVAAAFRAAIPEPAGWLLAPACLAALGLRARRRAASRG
jgi:hypothetical protein